jgi:nicotinamide-nucleotide amidase
VRRGAELQRVEQEAELGLRVLGAEAERGEDPEAVVAEQKVFEAAKTRADVRLQAALVALELLLP